LQKATESRISGTSSPQATEETAPAGDELIESIAQQW